MIAWFTRNGVAANLLMMIILVGGWASMAGIKIELFPKFDLDMINISVVYPGATPEELEESVLLRIEEELYDLEGIKKMHAIALEGRGVVTIEVEKGYNARELLGDVKVRVDAISTFPEDVEDPIVELPLIKQDVISVAIYGDVGEKGLKDYAETVREDLVKIPGVTQVDIYGVRDYELSIEISEFALRKYGLTFEEVARAVRKSSLDLPGGVIRSEGGEILLRSLGQAYVKEEFEAIVLITYPDGARITIGDVATVVDGFVDETLAMEFDGKSAVIVRAFEVGDQNTIDIANKVKAYVEEKRHILPEGMEMIIWGDWSFYLKGRLNMLIENGLYGLILVFALLTLFLRPSLAVWVTLGIPISFFGAFLVIPLFGISINIISLFGLIMVLGIVVDDAIVVGESIFSHSQKQGPGVDASIQGSHAVAIPVTFAVLTTAVAFLPILMLPGFQGKFMHPIPYVVIATLMFSLIESKLILPYHLSLSKAGNCDRQSMNKLLLIQRRIADGLESFILKYYKPFLEKALGYRYAILATFVGTLMVMISLIMVDRVRFVIFPSPPSDYVTVKVTMAEDTPETQTRLAMDRILAAMRTVIEDLEEKGHKNPIEHDVVIFGAQPFGGGPGGIRSSGEGAHVGEITVEMQKSENRAVSAPDFADYWREAIGVVPGVRELSFKARAADAGMPIDIQLSGRDFDQIREAANELKEKLGTYRGLFDIRDNYSGGKRELQIKIKPMGEALGLTQIELARQVRQAFYGEEAQRIQRGRDDVRVMVRYPQEQRRSLGHLENMRIRTVGGEEVPFYEVADVQFTRGSSTITRVDRQRALNVQADANKKIAQLEVIKAELSRSAEPSSSHKFKVWLYGLPGVGVWFEKPASYEAGFMAQLMDKYPGIQWSFEGEARQGTESIDSLRTGSVLVLCIIYALMAIPFRSYLQPLIIMSVMPFGLIGAVGGHILLDQPISMLSMMGMLAMAGVLVNDSLVLVDFINKQVASGLPLRTAIREAGVRRFRPILLTSLTTFAGLTPILLEQSLQAQFLIPMATSLGFGVLFGTFITLLLVPSCYLILEDVKGLFRWK